MHASKRSLRFHARQAGVVLALAAGPLTAAAAPTVWHCTLTADRMQLRCAVLDPSATSPEGGMEPVVRAGTRFPLDVQRRYTVDLLGPAQDEAFVALLAQSALCWRAGPCQAIVEAERPAPTLAQALPSAR